MDFVRTEVREEARHRRGQRRGVQGRLELRRDDRGLRGPPTRSSPRPSRPAPTATSTATPRWPTGWSQRRVRSGLPLFLGAYPITPAPTSCTSCPSTSVSVCGRSRPRTRSPASAPRSARRSVARLGRHHVLGTGHRAEGRDDRARVSPSSCRWSSVDIQRGGPSTGSCRPRPSSPTCCRRCSAATVRHRCRSSRPTRPATASTPRSRPPGSRLTYRTPVFLLSDGYIANGSEPWAVPSLDTLPDLQVEFATEPERRRATRKGRSCPTCATPRRWPARGRSRAPPASSTASAASRRPTAPATSATTRTTTTSWSAPGRRRSTALPRPSLPLEVEDPPQPGSDSGGARVLVLGWGSTYGPIGAACRQVRQTGASVAQAHLRHLNPFPSDLGEVLARYDTGRDS